MCSSKVFVIFLVAMLVASEVTQSSASPAPEPRWKVFKKIERVGQHIRDGIIKAGPAVAVVGSAAALG